MGDGIEETLVQRYNKSAKKHTQQYHKASRGIPKQETDGKAI